MHSARKTADTDKEGRKDELSSSTKKITQALGLSIIEDYNPAANSDIQSSQGSASRPTSPAASQTQEEAPIPVVIASPLVSSQPRKSASPAANAELEEEIYIMHPTPVPLKHKPESDYVRKSENLSKSFHDIYMMAKAKSKKEQNPSLYFFKQNKYEKSDPYMYELEAATSAFYHLLAPNHSPTARAIYDNKTMQYVGVMSKSLDGFKTTLADPLREEDLEIDALKYCDANILIEKLEALDERARVENLDVNNMAPGQIISEFPLENADHSIRRIPITAKDLRNFRIVKGNAIGLVISEIFCEDDCHTGNISKDGKRIDVDMSPWPVTFKFKKTGPVDWAFRDPTGRFNVTPRDIKAFPNVVDMDPFYFPTRPVKVIPEAFMSIASKIFSVSQNAFKSDANVIYQKLETHPVFIHYKFATLLKFIVTSATTYHQLAKLHIREESSFNNQSIVDMMTTFVDERLRAHVDALIQLDDFKKWMQINGEKCLKNIMFDFAIHNDKFAAKMEQKPLYQLQLIQLDQIVKTYANICAKIGIVRNPDHLIQEDQDLKALIEENKADLGRTFRFK